MTKLTRIGIGTLVVWGTIAALHARLNLGIDPIALLQGKKDAREEIRFRVGFLPVTCHLTCPVTDWIHKNRKGAGFFEPVRFASWPELKEAHLSGYTPATFMLAPMAMALAQQGVPVKIVYLGHRDGSALMVRKDSGIFTMKDLRGKRVAVPNRFSNQHLLVRRGLEAHGMSVEDIELLEMPPPDMPAALYAEATDAIISGEPFMGQTELDGYGRVLYQAKELWPDFISCVLVVNQRLIDEHPEQVQELVDGIAQSGLWMDQGQKQRMAAADAVAKHYYNQDPRLLRFVLSKPPDRVTYTKLRLVRKDFAEIERLAIAAEILTGPVPFEKYADIRFSENTTGVGPYLWESP